MRSAGKRGECGLALSRKASSQTDEPLLIEIGTGIAIARETGPLDDNYDPIPIPADTDFDEGAQTHWPAVYRSAYRLAGDSHTAELRLDHAVERGKLGPGSIGLYQSNSRCLRVRVGHGIHPSAAIPSSRPRCAAMPLPTSKKGRSHLGLDTAAHTY